MSVMRNVVSFLGGLLPGTKNFLLGIRRIDYIFVIPSMWEVSDAVSREALWYYGIVVFLSRSLHSGLETSSHTSLSIGPQECSSNVCGVLYYIESSVYGF